MRQERETLLLHRRLAAKLAAVVATCDALCDGAATTQDNRWVTARDPLSPNVLDAASLCERLDRAVDARRLRELCTECVNCHFHFVFPGSAPDDDDVCERDRLAKLTNAVAALAEFAQELLPSTGPDAKLAEGVQAADSKHDRLRSELESNGEALELVDHNDICRLLTIQRKRLRNVISEWRDERHNITDPCNYSVIRPLIVKQWPKKAKLFPESFARFQQILNERS